MPAAVNAYTPPYPIKTQTSLNSLFHDVKGENYRSFTNQSEYFLQHKLQTDIKTWY